MARVALEACVGEMLVVAPPNKTCNLKELAIFEEVAVYVTKVEWELLHPAQKALYREVMEENYGMVSSLGSEMALDGYSRSFLRPGMETDLMESALGFEELVIHFTAEEWAMMDLEQKTLYKEIMFEIDEMVISLGAALQSQCEERPSQSLWDWEQEENVMNPREKKQQRRKPTRSLMGKFGPCPDRKSQTQQGQRRGMRTRMSFERSKVLNSSLVLDTFQRINKGKKPSVGRNKLPSSGIGKKRSNKQRLTRCQTEDSSKTRRSPLDRGKRVTEDSRVILHRRFHKEEKVYTCPSCGKTFPEKSGLLQHQVIHAGEKPYRCLECEMTFRWKGNLSRHQKVHQSEKRHQCPDCGKSFNQSGRLISHRRTHTGEKPYRCTECGRSYYSQEHLSRHQTIHATKSELGYTCLKCGEVFCDERSMTRHRALHTRRKEYTCPECGKIFNQSRSLTSHRRIHTGESIHMCLVCGKGFTRRDTFTLHQRVHTGEKPYQCSECGKCFSRADVLASHQKIHTAEKQYTCFECGKNFHHPNNLIVHQIVHTGEKPYKCLECGKTFKHGQSLTFHHRMHSAKVEKTEDFATHMGDTV